MRFLSSLRVSRQRGRPESGPTCGHVDQIRPVTRASTGCQPCLDQGDTWVHLRMCMTDGLVLCCDSSRNQHAMRHARQHAPEHQIVRSIEPGEDWMWCYTDEVLVRAPAVDR